MSKDSRVILNNLELKYACSTVTFKGPEVFTCLVFQFSNLSVVLLLQQLAGILLYSYMYKCSTTVKIYVDVQTWMVQWLHYRFPDLLQLTGLYVC